MNEQQEKQIVKPTVHLNGTSAEELFRGYRMAYEAVKAASHILSCVEFNARDYYPQGDDAWPQAAQEMRERYLALEKIQGELLEITAHVQDYLKQ